MRTEVQNHSPATTSAVETVLQGSFLPFVTREVSLNVLSAQNLRSAKKPKNEKQQTSAVYHSPPGPCFL